MKKPSYKGYLLTLLSVIFAFNTVDRLALGLLLQDIKIDLALSDTQIGLLTGIAFALFYSLMGIPIARWADRGNRVTIITLTTAIWSGAVALCGFAGSFIQLLLIRVGVAIGEAGCVPPAHSLIADHFTRSERPRAVSRYMLGAPLSALIGFFFAGWLNELYGWRTTFMLLGLPGIALACLAWFTIREPRKASAMQGSVQSKSEVATPKFKEVYRQLWSTKSFRHLVFAFAVASFFGSGIGKWQPAFFIRSFGLETGELGTWFAVIYGGVGVFGIYLGGLLASRYAAQNEKLQLKYMAAVFCALAVTCAAVYLSPNHYFAFAMLALTTAGGNTITGPAFAMMQTLVPSHMRAMAIALTYLLANLIGMGLGPLAVGALSDALRPLVGEESLRYALLAMCPGYFWGAWHLWRANKTVADDIRCNT